MRTKNYENHFPIIRPCGQQLNALDRFVNAAYSPPWPSGFYNFSFIATTQLCGLKPFRKPV